MRLNSVTLVKLLVEDNEITATMSCWSDYMSSKWSQADQFSQILMYYSLYENFWFLHISKTLPAKLPVYNCKQEVLHLFWLSCELLESEEIYPALQTVVICNIQMFQFLCMGQLKNLPHRILAYLKYSCLKFHESVNLFYHPSMT